MDLKEIGPGLIEQTPTTYTKFRRYFVLMLVSLAGLHGPLSSTIYFPSAESIIQELQTTSFKFDLTIGAFMITLGVMPLIWGGISDRYGRRWVYIISLLIASGGNIGAIFSNNFEMILAMRVIQAFGSSASIVIGVGVVADIFPKGEIGQAMSIFFVGVLIGPIIGPVLGGFLDTAFGWRSNFLFLSILSGLTTILFFIFFKETLPQIQPLPIKIQLCPPRIKCNGPIFNPFASLWYLRYPCVIIASGITAISFGIFFGIESFHSRSMSLQYKLKPQSVGLTFMILGAGSIIGNFTGGQLADYMSRNSSDDKGKPLPEARLRGVWACILVLTSGLLFYGWSLQFKAPIYLPLLASFLIGFGYTSASIGASSYLVELTPAYASSITAAASAMRMLFATIASSINSQIIETLDFGWGITLYAGISIFAFIFTLLLVAKGQSIRHKTGPHPSP